MEPQAPIPTEPQATEPTTPVPAPVLPAAPVVPGAVATPPAGTPDPLAQPANKRFPTWLKVVLGIVAALIIVIVAIFVVVGQATKSAAKVSDQFVTDLQADKPSDAYQLASADFRSVTDQDQLSKLFDSVSPALQGKTTITGRAINKGGGKNTVVIVYSVATSAGTKYMRLTLILQKDATWKVEGFKSSDTPLDANYLTTN
ncbi:MAG: hypothetical protein ABI221_02015 [Candidatus Saccharimonadales bacterium]